MLLSYFPPPPHPTKERISAVNLTAISVLSTGGWEPGCHHAFSVFGWDYSEVPPALCPIPPTAHTYLTLVKSTSVVLQCPQDGVCLLPLRAQSAGPVPSKIILPGLTLLRY